MKETGRITIEQERAGELRRVCVERSLDEGRPGTPAWDRAVGVAKEGLAGRGGIFLRSFRDGLVPALAAGIILLAVFFLFLMRVMS